MTDYRVFELPTVNDDTFVIGRTWCALNTRLRNGDSLDEVEINWMDSANTWLLESKQW